METPPVIGNFRCTGKGAKEEGCMSLLEIRWDNVYIRHSHRSYISFRCPVCGTQTNIKYSKYRARQPSGLILPSKTDFYILNGIDVERTKNVKDTDSSATNESCRRWV